MFSIPSKTVYESQNHTQQKLSEGTMSLLGIRPIPPSPPSSSAAFGSHLPFQSQLQLPGPQRPLQFPRTHRHRARALRVEEYLPYMREGRSRGEMAVRYECRRVKQKENPFDRLPNEMVLRIFKNLGPSSLAAASGVCRRFKGLASAPELWERIDAAGRTLQIDNFVSLLSRSPKVLRLARCVLPPLTTPIPLLNNLTHLDLSALAGSSPSSTISALIAASPNLMKLSLEALELPASVLDSVASTSLTVLNIAMAWGVNASSLSDMLRRCGQSLKELNVSCILGPEESRWSCEDVAVVVAALPGSLEMLNLSGQRYSMKDEHVRVVATSCPNLIDLDLSDCAQLGGTCLSYLTSLSQLQHLALSRCYSIPPAAYPALKEIPTLKFLELFSLFKESSIRALENNLLSGVKINQFPLSSIARPTVGSRRRSIWGVRFL